ncbi:MAG: DUF5615 family PIN-like protein [Chloroflexi bacterium]|nr:DUF5615 family PIN-like protein [Chloroflexota bacterium]MCL5274514.1 DUF5615 family PIN-like protein [Chloroflexota bacterium]
MDDRVRFYLDENVDPRIARALRRMDIDAITTVEANMRTLNDAAQWDYAKSQQRVIVTSDDDFLKRAAEDSDHPGLIFFMKDTRSNAFTVTHPNYHQCSMAPFSADSPERNSRTKTCAGTRALSAGQSP